MEALPRLSRETIRQLLKEFALQPLFIEELGWDHGGIDTTVTVADKTFALEAVAQKRGFVAYQCVSGRTHLPDYPTRQKIDRILAKTSHEHLIVFTTTTHSAQCWQWVKRESGQRDRYRQETYSPKQSAEALIEKLERLRFTLEEEERVSIADAALRVAKAFDVEKVTKRFYDRFRAEHQAFLGFIKGIREVANREWYASLMLNRMMFIYFIQKRSFLDNDPDYLRNRLATVAKTKGSGKFHSFYRLFLRRLFHEGLGQPEANRDPALTNCSAASRTSTAACSTFTTWNATTRTSTSRTAPSSRSSISSTPTSGTSTTAPCATTTRSTRTCWATSSRST